MDAIVYIGIRTIVGFSIAALGGGLGMLAAWMVWSQSFGETLNFVYFQTTLASIGAGIGAFMGWLRLDNARTVLIILLVIAILAASVGAWGGLGYARAVYGVPGIRDPSRLTIVFGAAITANIPGLCIGIVWALRGGRI